MCVALFPRDATGNSRPFKKWFGVFGVLCRSECDAPPEVCDVIALVDAKRARIFVRLRLRARVEESHVDGVLVIFSREVLRKLTQAEFQKVGHGAQP